MSSNDDGDTLADYWRDVNAHTKKAAAKRRRLAAATFDENKALALSHGYILQWHSESHFQITRRGEWTLNLYPGNQRIYRGFEKKAPYLELPRPWTIRDVIVAAAKKESENGAAKTAGIGVVPGATQEGMPQEGTSPPRSDVRADGGGDARAPGGSVGDAPDVQGHGGD